MFSSAFGDSGRDWAMGAASTDGFIPSVDYGWIRLESILSSSALRIARARFIQALELCAVL
jgi:hypothetical protein